MASGKIQVHDITRSTDAWDRDIVCVYIKNRNNESCMWKKIIITLTTVIELEYDWKEILGDD